MDSRSHLFSLNYPQLRLRNLFRYKYAVVAKQPDAVANIQYSDEFHEFYTLSGQVNVYGMARVHDSTKFKSIFSSGHP